MKSKTLNIADNSGTRRRNPMLRIWRNDITGMEPGSVVSIRFTDDYTRNGINKIRPRKYIVVDIKFDDDYARERGRHTVTLRKEEEGRGDESPRTEQEVA